MRFFPGGANNEKQSKSYEASQDAEHFRLVVHRVDPEFGKQLVPGKDFDERPENDDGGDAHADVRAPAGQLELLPQCHFFELGRFFNLCLLRVSCRAGDKVVFIIDISGFSRFFQGASRRKPTCTIRILQVAIAPCPSIRAANLSQIGHQTLGGLPACVMQHASRLAEGVAGYVEA